jgi:riboflavin synthase
LFTGLIEDLGSLVESESLPGGGARLRFACSFGAEVAPGESIAVNGVCLTAMDPNDEGFAADTMGVTLERSSLGDLAAGDPVNLERAMPANGRFGGHIVQGHVDGVGMVTGVRPDGNAVVVSVEVPAELLRYMVPKGSITVDGTSLTLAEVNDSGFDVWLIPETRERTRFGIIEAGMRVNLEVDILAKYVERLSERP